MGAHDDLLKRFQPVLRYDSNEQFFADSAEQYMVDARATRCAASAGRAASRRGPRHAPTAPAASRS